MNIRIDADILAAALETPESDVPLPTRQQASSLVAQIGALEAGESASKAVPVDPAMSIAEYATHGVAMRERLRQSVNSSLRVAKGRTGGEYEIEIADLMTTKRQLYIVAVITRTA